MTTPIGALTPSTPAAVTNAASTPTTADSPTDHLGKDAFLKLLVAQLKYQNPMNPTDSSQFLAQTAQFTMVEKLTDIADAITQNAAMERLTGAAHLIGREVTYLDQNGTAQTGVVTGTDMHNGTPTLAVGDTEVALGSVLSVREQQPAQ